MSEAVHGFDHSTTADSSTENVHDVVDQVPSLTENNKRRHQPQQTRQLLSCTKCRERKVKCDRTKPCSACCARGQPKECHFVAENGDYAPIQQSYELRKLRAENLRLKERLRACKIPIEDDGSDAAASPDSQLGERPAGAAQKRRAARQRRFQGSEWTDSIYFGSPGLASVVTDFASLHLAPLSTQSLAHLMPRGPDMYTTENPPAHPFATLFKATPEECLPELLSCLPAREELFDCLDFFEKRVHVCAFPHVPMEITRSEVERFLSDARRSAQLCPDMLALLFAALALGAQHCTWDKSGGQWKAETMREELRKGDVYIAAAMQALRMASFMHKPTLLGIQTLIMIGPFLTNSGRFLDAWTLFGTTIRLAHAIGLHRHPKYLDPAPPTQRECAIRQTLWWWMLHMDQEYSMTLGRPLGISGIGDCPPPHELTTNRTMLRFGEFVNHFTVLARQILSSDRLTNTKIDEFTDSLKGLLDTMPEMLQFDESWLDANKDIPEWPLGTMAAAFYCKTHTYLILLNRQRLDKQGAQPCAHQTPSTTKSSPPGLNPANTSAARDPSPTISSKASLRGRALVLSSSEDLLTAFLFFYMRVPAALICWTLGQQAFNSCMILLLDAMETGDLSRTEKVEKAYVVFLQLKRDGVHELASLAVDRVSRGILELQRMTEQQDAHGQGPAWLSASAGTPMCDVDMQGTVGSEAIPCSSGMHDTVMGNTGMLLLEDPGLQSFVPEAFAPLTWAVARDGPGSESSVRMGATADQDDTQGEREPFDDTKPMLQDQGAHDARSSEQMHGASGSAPGSARLRFATFSTAPSQEPLQPQGLTSPTSRPTSANFMQEHYHPFHRAPGTPGDRHQLSAPHSAHHSYPSLDPLSQCPGGRLQHYLEASAGVSSGEVGFQAPRRDSCWGEELYTASLARVLPRFAASQPFLPTLPPFAAPSTVAAARSSLSCGNPNVHPSWAARPAAPMSSVSEPALSFPHVSNRPQDIPVFPQQPALGAAWQYALPLHLSCPDNGTGAALAGMQAERMEVEVGGWRRWVGSSAAG